MRAVVDRIVDSKWVVLIVGEDEQEFNVPVEKLSNDIKEGSIVDVTIENGEIVSVLLLQEDTNEQEVRINEKLNLLKARKRSNFKRK